MAMIFILDGIFDEGLWSHSAGFCLLPEALGGPFRRMPDPPL